MHRESCPCKSRNDTCSSDVCWLRHRESSIYGRACTSQLMVTLGPLAVCHMIEQDYVNERMIFDDAGSALGTRESPDCGELYC
ncbi:hypothetical protein VTO42DRAFT_4957 [Malbranchea cinnamomea]